MMQFLKKSKLIILAYNIFSYVKYYPRFINSYYRFRNLADSRFRIQWKNRYICHEDNTTQTDFDFHYVYHTSWAARVLTKLKPKKHIDISSSLYFNSIVSAFIPIEFYDYRRADLTLSNFKSKTGDLLALPFKSNSVESISCMHVIEHIGLGRYGDPIDPKGDLKAIAELKRVVRKGGSLLFVTPIGKRAQIKFNAHRIYTYKMILTYFSDFKLREFAYISEHHPEKGLQIKPSAVDMKKDEYSTACFWFVKR